MANIKQIFLFPNKVDYLETFYNIFGMKIPSLSLLTRNISYFALHVQFFIILFPSFLIQISFDRKTL